MVHCMACTAWCTGQMLDGALHGVLDGVHALASSDFSLTDIAVLAVGVLLNMQRRVELAGGVCWRRRLAALLLRLALLAALFMMAALLVALLLRLALLTALFMIASGRFNCVALVRVSLPS